MADKVLDSSGVGAIYNIAQGVIHAVKKGARITNNSYGNYAYPPSDTMKVAFQYAWSLKVGATGNDNTEQRFYPALLSKVQRPEPIRRIPQQQAPQKPRLQNTCQVYVK